MGANWVNSQRDDIKDMVSDIKVELTDKQSEVLNEIFTKIGNKTSYHGMMDIEFIVNPIEGIVYWNVTHVLVVGCTQP
jgi:hypothetical protein